MSDVMDDVIAGATVKVVKESEPNPLSAAGDIGIPPIMKSMFAVDDFISNEQKTRLTEMWQWAKEWADGADDLSAIAVLKDMRFRVGAQPFDKNYLSHVYEYMSLRAQAKKLTNQAKAMEL